MGLFSFFSKDVVDEDKLAKEKVGKIAKEAIPAILQANKKLESEVYKLLDKDYYKKVFNLNFPVLVSEKAEYDKSRYYTDSIKINGSSYKLCSQWFDKDREKLMKWIKKNNKQ